ncbi:hypothetical protein SLEP1_g29758 [Rubroshorea leprosula]|uniref:Uncharacterized protein n=1 Tax=Rubroshorea leprosula TaxID=152421 RepID=A0AAV5K3S6_9ROSI|nr:hypothetical protein SLEP1_g29758 [Rubroshorea leprosula]
MTKSAALMLLFLNLFLYLIIIVIASWAVNHAIERTHETASVLAIPARIFPMWFPMGNLATGFFVIFSLIAGVVGIATSVTGIGNVLQWDRANLSAAAGSSLLSWALTLLAMGFACKEMDIGWTDANLRTLEAVTIIASATQLFCTGAIHAGAAQDVEPFRTGRV